MASSADAVRNFIYDVHLYNLQKGWQIVQQLAEKKLDTWEEIHNAFPVKDPNQGIEWDESDEQQVAAFVSSCPLIGDRLAAQLAAQASIFIHGSDPPILQRGHSGRLGSLRERMSRLQMKEKSPSKLRQTFGNGVRFHVGQKSRLVPFSEAVEHPGFSA